ALHEYAQARSDLEALVAGRREAERRLDLLRFQVNEIESADLQPDEVEILTADRSRLANAERLQVLARAAHDALTDHALEALPASATAVGELAAIDAALTTVHERLQGATFELEDIAQEL